MDKMHLSVGDYLILRGLLTGILEDHLQGALPVQEPQELQVPLHGLAEQHERWLMMLDLCSTPAALRLGIQRSAPTDAALVTLLNYLMIHNRQVDHDRFDWVLTFLFKRRLESGELAGVSSIGGEIVEMFPELPQTPLSLQSQANVNQLLSALETMKSFRTLGELTRSGLVSKCRELKESFGAERYRPVVLATVVNYNLVLGRTFRVLLDQVAQQNRELAAQLAAADYRGNGQSLRELAATAETSEAKQPLLRAPAAPPASKPPLSPKDPHAYTGSIRLPADPARQSENVVRAVEQRHLASTLAKLGNYFQAAENKNASGVKVGEGYLVLEEWEVRALATGVPETEKSFRAEFARALKDAVVLLYRLIEEKAGLSGKAGAEYSRAQDSLEWLQTAGQERVQTMQQFADEVAKRGLPDKQQQILITALRLSDLLQGKPVRTAADLAARGSSLPSALTAAAQKSSS